MAEVVRSFKFKNSDDIPESLSPRIGFDEKNHLVNLYETGEVSQARNLGHAVVELALKADQIEEEFPSEASLETTILMQRFDALEQRLANLEDVVKNGSSSFNLTPDLESEVSRIVDERTKDLSDRVSQLETEKDQLTQERDSLREELAMANDNDVEPNISEVGGFRINDQVAVQRPDGKYGSGFKVDGFTKEDDRVKVKIRHISTDEVIPVEPERIKKISEIDQNEYVVADEPPVVRTGRLVNPRFMRRTRDRFPGQVSRTYYEDDRGYYYQDADGRYVNVSREEAIGGGAGAVAVAGALVAGAVLWELIGEKIFGYGEGSSQHLKEVIHNQAIEINDLNKVNSHLSKVQEQMTAQHAHAHKHDLQAIHGLHNQISRDHAQEIRKINELKGEVIRSQSAAGGFHDQLQNTGAYWGIRYPWDWAANKVGTYRAEGWLHILASRAADHGHKVMWLHNRGKEILKVDGTTNTAQVLKVIGQYQ